MSCPRVYRDKITTGHDHMTNYITAIPSQCANGQAEREVIGHAPTWKGHMGDVPLLELDVLGQLLEDLPQIRNSTLRIIQPLLTPDTRRT